MKIGIGINTPSYLVDVSFIAIKVEELGFDSLWYAEHPVIPVDFQPPHKTGRPSTYATKEAVTGYRPYAHFGDPLISLAIASAVTTTLELGTAICLVAERNPLLLAKEIATLDLYSGGRFQFGIGGGWIREETEIMGGNFDRRWAQIKESILAMKELWTHSESEFHGEYFDFPPVLSFPKPAQKPHPPILLGGTSSKVFKRIVAWADGWIPNKITVNEALQARQSLDTLAIQARREPSSITIVLDHADWPPDWDLLRRLAECKVIDGVTIRPKAPKSEAELTENLEYIAFEASQLKI